MTAIIQPILHYGDLDKAVAYLIETYGFAEHVVHRTPEGKPMYAELVIDGCYIGVGETSPEPSTFNLGPAAIYVALDDPDMVHDRALAAGAEIVMGLVDQDYGSREFATRDYEGNVWCFGTFRAGTK